jgi:hypothetical protein
LARTAVTDTDPAIRGTAVLALQVPDAHQALSRLDWALRELPGSWQRIWRKAEVCGLLEDEIPKFQALNGTLTPVQRSLIWLWRMLRSMRHQYIEILLSMLGAALGGGAGLGVWRGIVASLAGSPVPGFLGFVHVIYGMLLGAGLILGMLLGRVLSLEKSGDGPGISTSQKIAWLPLLLGGVGFGLAHAWIFVLNGGRLFSDNWIVVGMGFVAGFVLSGLLVKILARPGDEPARIESWRYVAVALAFAAIQVVLNTFGQRSLAIAYSEQTFRADFFRFAVSPAISNLMEALPFWPQGLAVLDASVVGIVLAVGTIFGLLVIQRIYTRLEMR